MTVFITVASLIESYEVIAAAFFFTFISAAVVFKMVAKVEGRCISVINGDVVVVMATEDNDDGDIIS